MALILASVSLVLALASLFWQVWTVLRLDRARLHVDVRSALIQDSPTSPPSWAVVVDAVNVGRRPTEVRSLALWLGPALRWYHYLLPDRFRPSRPLAQLLPDETGVGKHSAQLPQRLDVGGSASVYYQRRTITSIMEGDTKLRTMWGWAEGSTAHAESRRRRIGVPERITPADFVRGPARPPELPTDPA